MSFLPIRTAHGVAATTPERFRLSAFGHACPHAGESPALVNGVLQWVLRPVYTFAYYIRMLIRRIRAARDFDAAGYNVSGVDGGPSGNSAPYMVNRRFFGPGGV